MWPLSRESYPKQFLALNSGRTMLQETARRLDGLSGTLEVHRAPIVVCNAEHRFIVAQQLAEVGVLQPTVVLESTGKNTAPALTLAALMAVESGEDPLLLAMPADHVVSDRSAFHAAIVRASAAARAGAMVTFGIVPQRVETGYGYIRFDRGGANGVKQVLAFTEKPDFETAAGYLESGDYLWNSGIFLVRATVWLAAIGRFRQDILDACMRSVAGAARDADFLRPDGVAFAACPSESIDYAVMERLPNHPETGIPAAVVPMAAGWSDLGAWDALWEVLERDADGNAAVGDCLLHDSSHTLLHASSRFVAGVGLAGIVVVETPDAVLVADKSRTQEVKTIVSRLRAEGRSLADTHRKVHRPWGWYDSIDFGERFQVKRIVVKPGAALSLQMHHHRAEHWIVVRGTAEVTNGDRTLLLGENESTFIPLGHVHRLANPGKVPLEIIEVQSGSYLGEDDIVRFDDTYGRAVAPQHA
jgi:mannose-1-phosphate guanylyltransferase/mannose-6-phosphate isomerase